MTIPTLGIWRQPEEIDYKRMAIDGFECSTEEFYLAIEEELRIRKVPGLEITREFFSEGGIMAPKREYLRLRRDRLVFDICSAPFGGAWFFSYRFSELPNTMMVWELLLVLAVIAGVAIGYLSLFGLIAGSVIFGGTLLGISLILRNSIVLGFQDLDAWLLQIPIIGAVYEGLFRRDTYFQVDSLNMFGELMRKIIEAHVDAVTADKGVHHTGFEESNLDVHKKFAELLKRSFPEG